MSNDIKKYKKLIESVENSNPQMLNEFNIFKSIKDKYRNLQQELRNEKVTGLKKGEYATSGDISRFISRWVEESIDYDYFIHVGDHEAQEFVSELESMGFESQSTEGRSLKINGKENVGTKALYVGKVIVDNGVLYNKRVPNMLAICMVIVDNDGYVYVYAKAVKGLETGKPMDTEYTLFNSNPEPLDKNTSRISSKSPVVK